MASAETRKADAGRSVPAPESPQIRSSRLSAVPAEVASVRVASAPHPSWACLDREARGRLAERTFARDLPRPVHPPRRAPCSPYAQANGPPYGAPILHRPPPAQCPEAVAACELRLDL